MAALVVPSARWVLIPWVHLLAATVWADSQATAVAEVEAGWVVGAAAASASGGGADMSANRRPGMLEWVSQSGGNFLGGGQSPFSASFGRRGGGFMGGGGGVGSGGGAGGGDGRMSLFEQLQRMPSQNRLSSGVNMGGDGGLMGLGFGDMGGGDAGRRGTSMQQQAGGVAASGMLSSQAGTGGMQAGMGGMLQTGAGGLQQYHPHGMGGQGSQSGGPLGYDGGGSGGGNNSQLFVSPQRGLNRQASSSALGMSLPPGAAQMMGGVQTMWNWANLGGSQASQPQMLPMRANQVPASIATTNQREKNLSYPFLYLLLAAYVRWLVCFFHITLISHVFFFLVSYQGPVPISFLSTLRVFVFYCVNLTVCISRLEY